MVWEHIQEKPLDAAESIVWQALTQIPELAARGGKIEDIARVARMPQLCIMMAIAELLAKGLVTRSEQLTFVAVRETEPRSDGSPARRPAS